MATMKLKDYDVPITLPNGLSEKQVQEFKPFTTWVSTLTSSLALQRKNDQHPFHKSPYSLRSITIQSYDIFGSERVGFLKAKASVTNDDDEHLPASVFLRGPSVAMLIVLVPDDAADPEERYAILTVQPRVPVGSLAFVELPAGMVDDAGSFAGAAAKEIQEELGMEIKEDELTCLSELTGGGSAGASGSRSGNSDGSQEEKLPPAMYPSAGGCDEHVTIYAHEKKVPRDKLDEWSGKLTGLRDHGEKITLKLVPFKNLWREGARDAKCLAAVALWEGLKREGKI